MGVSRSGLGSDLGKAGLTEGVGEARDQGRSLYVKQARISPLSVFGGWPLLLLSAW